MPPPTRLSPRAQSLIGITLGASLGLASVAPGLLRIPTTVYHWLVFYAGIWLAAFFALHRKLTTLVVAAFLTGAAILIFANHYLF